MSNGYPAKLIKNIQNSAKYKPHQPRPKNKNRNTTYISLPYIDEQLTHKITTAAKHTDLDITIAWKSGETLSNILIRLSLQPPPCPKGHRKSCSTCDAGLQGRCHIKNTVYIITCLLCNMFYIGETTRQIRTRFMEHLGHARRKEKGKYLGDHTILHHPTTRITDKDFSIKIIHVCKDSAECKIKESIEIRNRRPHINKQFSSWRLLQPVPYTYTYTTSDQSPRITLTTPPHIHR